MNAERRPPQGEPANAKQPGGLPGIVTSDARLAGELASARYGALAGRVALPEVPKATGCTGRCWTLGVAQREFYGEQYGCCPCIIDAWPVPA